MSLRRFKTLIAIAEHGTFTKAANAIYLTPSAVSQQMSLLEDELEVSLFDRSRRPPELTPAGYALVPRAKELVRVYAALKQSMAGELNADENLSVGTVPTAMTGIMPKALKALQENNDRLHIRIYPGLSDDLHAQVDRGFLDAAIITEPPTVYASLQWKPFAEEPLVVLTSSETKSDDAREILETEPFIRFNRKAWVGRIIDQWLVENNIRVNEKMELDTLEAISAMVMNKLGSSIVPMNCFTMLEREHLKAIPLSGAKITRVLGVVCRHDSGKHTLIELLWNELSHVSEQSGREMGSN